MTPRSERPRRAMPLIAGSVALALVVLGVVLVVRGGDDTPERSSAPTTSGGPKSTLPASDTSRAGVERLSGLVLPASTADFLSARLSNGSELDVTFTMAPSDQEAFVSASGLPGPTAGTRVVTHASPLWKLNADGTVLGVTDARGDVNRAVELVPEGERLRARVVLSSRR